MKYPIILFVFFSINFRATSQPDSTTIPLNNKYDSEYLSLRKNIVPAGLIAASLVIEFSGIKEQWQDAIPDTHTHIEDYLQYTPVVILYGADLAGVKHKNTVFNLTKYLIIAEVTTSLLTQLIKNVTGVTRPNSGSYSYPSGHTSQSFSCASVLFNEFIETNKPVAWSGYLFAVTTGTLRVTNNKHWVPDVLAGAGLAIIVTNLVYYFHPLRNWDPFHPNKSMSIIPRINPDTGILTVGISVQLK